MTTVSIEVITSRIEAKSQTETGPRAKTRAALNQALADLVVARSMIHQIHWYMRGTGFLRLHKSMDKLMDALNEHLDELSERLITLGGAPYSTLKEFSEASLLEEVPGDYKTSVETYLHRLVDIYTHLGHVFQVGLAVSDEEGDDPSNGLFADAQGEAEKNIWQLRAELGLEPGLY